MQHAPELKRRPLRPPPRFDRHWHRSLLFTLALIALVNAAVGADRTFALASLGVCAVAFGFFYLTFPGGMHFGLTLANFLAAYECAFIAFHEANFHEAAYLPSIISLTLPVLGFLSGCFLRRPDIAHAIKNRRVREPERLPRLSRWLPADVLWPLCFRSARRPARLQQRRERQVFSQILGSGSSSRTDVGPGSTTDAAPVIFW